MTILEKIINDPEILKELPWIIDEKDFGIIVELETIRKISAENPETLPAYFYNVMFESVKHVARAMENAQDPLSRKEIKEFSENLTEYYKDTLGEDYQSLGEVMIEMIERQKKIVKAIEDHDKNEEERFEELNENLENTIIRTVNDEGEKTRACIRKIGEDIEKTVREEGRETRREIKGAKDEILNGIHSLDEKFVDYINYAVNQIKTYGKENKKEIIEKLLKIYQEIHKTNTVVETILREHASLKEGQDNILLTLGVFSEKLGEYRKRLEELIKEYNILQENCNSISGEISRIRGMIEEILGEYPTEENP